MILVITPSLSREALLGGTREEVTDTNVAEASATLGTPRALHSSNVSVPVMTLIPKDTKIECTDRGSRPTHAAVRSDPASKSNIQRHFRSNNRSTVTRRRRRVPGVRKHRGPLVEAYELFHLWPFSQSVSQKPEMALNRVTLPSSVEGAAGTVGTAPISDYRICLGPMPISRTSCSYIIGEYTPFLKPHTFSLCFC